MPDSSNVTFPKSLYDFAISQTTAEAIKAVFSTYELCQTLDLGSNSETPRAEQGAKAYTNKHKGFEDRAQKRRLQRLYYAQAGDWLNAELPGRLIHAIGLCNLFPSQIAHEMIQARIPLSTYWGFETDSKVWGLLCKEFAETNGILRPDKFSRTVYDDIWKAPAVLEEQSTFNRNSRVGVFDLDFCGSSDLVKGMESGQLIDLLDLSISQSNPARTPKGFSYRFAVIVTYCPRRSRARDIITEIKQNVQTRFKVEHVRSDGYRDGGGPMKTALYLCSSRSKE